MARCVELALRGAGRVSPNPMVGCVIARGGRVLAEGFHARLGGAHAEVAALEKLGEQARGATMYVNLEPCVHEGRTGPCAPRVLEAGIARLVVGMRDPIRGHGGGAAWLRRRGVDVAVGVMRAECEDLNRAFVMWALERRPWFLLKAAMSLDGKLATRTGESRWITGPAARRDGHRLRAELDAILVGVGTVRADDPALTVRGVRGRDPVRVVLDSRLRTPASARVLPANADSRARCIVATTAAAPAARARALALRGAELWRLPARRGRVSLPALAARLAKADIASVLVEGGGEVHAAFLAGGLADELRLYVAPLVIGGRDAPGWAGGEGVARLARARRLAYAAPPERLGEDLVIRARLR
jgi:diaminohydroxyphosphoribosylaminopyrimidine deaminase/5-amino-6-(5-phosphoribosylamino)uracil reductase